MGLTVDDEGFIYHCGRPVPLPPKEQGVFRLLILGWPKTVTKEAFAQQIWAGRMSDESLARCITQLRHALSKIASVKIQTAYSRGYRLVTEDLPDSSSRAPQSNVHSRLLSAAMASPQAVETLVYARQLIERRTPTALVQAESLLRQLVSENPTYVSGALGFAECIAAQINSGLIVNAQVIDEALDLLATAGQTNPSIEGLSSQVAHLLDCAWRFEDAHSEHERAVAAAPDDAITQYYYGWHLLATGNPQEAVLRFRRAAELNPVSPTVGVMLARAILCTGDHAASLEQADKTRAKHPDSPQAYLYFLSSRAFAKPSAELVQLISQIVLTPGSWAFAPSTVSYVLARCGARDEALQIIADWGNQNASIRAMHASALNALGLINEAMNLVQEAADVGCGFLPILVRAPENIALAGHPEYDVLYKKIFGTDTSRNRAPR